MNYYIYYRLTPERVEPMRGAVQALFALLQQAHGVQGRWMRRRDDPATYMEVYEGVRDEDAAAFEALLEREGAKLGVPRKLERFVCA